MFVPMFRSGLRGILYAQLGCNFRHHFLVMQGVRRFFVATSGPTTPSPFSPTGQSTVIESATESNAAPSKSPPAQTVFPLTISTGKQLYPRSKPPADTKSPSSSPVTTTTAGLYIRRDGPTSPRRKRPSEASSFASTAPLNPSSRSSIPVRDPSRTLHSTTSSTSMVNSPASSKVTHVSKPSVSALDVNWTPPTNPISTRDDLLMSLLANEAIVDSRNFEVLSSEDVEELKREQQLISSRLVSVRKKVALETKIRDAALNLQKLQTVKRLSKQNSDQVDAGTRKVEASMKELSKLIERSGEVESKLLQHRAAVLSSSVRNLEAKLNPPNASGDTPDDITRILGSSIASRGTNSPTSSVVSVSTRNKFDGAHLFAGHAEAVIPGPSRKLLNPASIVALEEKFKNTQEELDNAKARESELEKQMKLLELERKDVEATLNSELRTAEETISKLEREMTKMETAEESKQEWERERMSFEKELKERSKSIEVLQQRLAALQAERNNASLAKDKEVRRLQEDWDKERVRRDHEQRDEVERMREMIKQLQPAAEALGNGRDLLLSSLRSHNIAVPRDTASLSSLASSLSAHVVSVTSKLEQSERDKAELVAVRKRHEEDIRSNSDLRERLERDLEDAMKEKEVALKASQGLEIRIKEQTERAIQLAKVKPTPPVPVVSDKVVEEHARTLKSLNSLWSVLPSVEARASKIKLPAISGVGVPSLSDMDVRALKSLYDPKVGFSSPTVSGEFDIEEFVARVQALLADDRALIARLIRFAQSHDLLRNNAERAQKLAQDSNKGLEMYQTQVKSLEERSATLNHKQLELLDEINSLQHTIKQTMQEKRDIESRLAEQAETVHNLQAANNTLSARALAFAEEAASAPTVLKAKLEAQLSDLQTQLKDAQDEIERMQTSESTQRVALLDELNSLQQENGKLRDQLRVKK